MWQEDSNKDRQTVADVFTRLRSKPGNTTNNLFTPKNGLLDGQWCALDKILDNYLDRDTTKMKNSRCTQDEKCMEEFEAAFEEMSQVAIAEMAKKYRRATISPRQEDISSVAILLHREVLRSTGNQTKRDAVIKRTVKECIEVHSKEINKFMIANAGAAFLPGKVMRIYRWGYVPGTLDQQCVIYSRVWC